MSGPTCFYCGEPVDTTDRLGVWQAVWGWERMGGKRASGVHAGSDVYGRRRFNRWAHSSCVSLERSGVSARQEALL
jgi:hypothetical protein